MMKFYYDDTLIRTSKAHIYTHAIVFPGVPGSGKRWAVHSCHHSLAAAKAMLARTRRGMALYNPDKAAALRIVPLEKR